MQDFLRVEHLKCGSNTQRNRVAPDRQYSLSQKPGTYSWRNNKTAAIAVFLLKSVEETGKV